MSESSGGTGQPVRILALVPHEPTLDPRVGWVMELCADVARTEVVACVQGSRLPDREYDGRLSIERIDPLQFLTPREVEILIRGRVIARAGHSVWTALLHFQDAVLKGAWRLISGTINLVGLGRLLGPALYRAKERLRRAVWGERLTEVALPSPGNIEDVEQAAAGEGDDTTEQGGPSGIREGEAGDDPPQPVPGQRRSRFREVLRELYLVSRPLYRRARASCPIPALVVCNDLHGLLGASRLKRQFGCQIIYDTHELWPEAFRAHQRFWEKLCISLLERRAIRHVDVVVAVTPQIAEEYRRRYRPPTVLSVPNAEPWMDNPAPSFGAPQSRPLRVLLQGQVAPGRGIRRLLRQWRDLDVEGVVFILRCVPNDFASNLKREFRDMVEHGKLTFPAPVTRLIEAASEADVGVIPYPGPSLNHLYACPNKLAQYMQAGLAILNNSDQLFVSGMVNSYACGLTFELDDPDSLRRAVAQLVSDPAGLAEMKRRSFEATRFEFNWSVQSRPLRAAIQQAMASRLATQIPERTCE